MAQTHTQAYRAFDIEAEIDTSDGHAQVTQLTIGIKGQPKRIPIVPDAFTSVDFVNVDQAVEAALTQARRTIDMLLDAG